MPACHPLRHMRVAEALLPTLDNPRHRVIVECDPPEVVTPERVADMLAPVLARGLPGSLQISDPGD